MKKVLNLTFFEFFKFWIHVKKILSNGFCESWVLGTTLVVQCFSTKFYLKKYILPFLTIGEIFMFLFYEQNRLESIELFNIAEVEKLVVFFSVFCMQTFFFTFYLNILQIKYHLYDIFIEIKKFLQKKNNIFISTLHSESKIANFWR